MRPWQWLLLALAFVVAEAAIVYVVASLPPQ